MIDLDGKGRVYFCGIIEMNTVRRKYFVCSVGTYAMRTRHLAYMEDGRIMQDKCIVSP
jgi:hypothetical protein